VTPRALASALAARLDAVVPAGLHVRADGRRASILLIGGLIAPQLLNVPFGDWQHILASYLFIPSLRGGDEIRPVMALGWTLNLEMFFYVLFAGALLLPLRRGMIALALVISGLALAGALRRPSRPAGAARRPHPARLVRPDRAPGPGPRPRPGALIRHSVGARRASRAPEPGSGNGRCSDHCHSRGQ